MVSHIAPHSPTSLRLSHYVGSSTHFDACYAAYVIVWRLSIGRIPASFRERPNQLASHKPAKNSREWPS